MTLPDSFPWGQPTSRSSGISSASVGTDAGVVGSEIDNSVNRDRFAMVEIAWSFATAPTAKRSLLLYFLKTINGTDYEDGSTSDQPKGAAVCAVTPDADTNTHRQIFCDIPIPPMKFKPLLWNFDTGQTATVTVTIKTYNEQVAE